MADQTKKERNTQRRKRRWGVEHKAYEMGKLCGFEVALIMHNPENDEYYTFRTTDQISWNMDQIVIELSEVMFDTLTYQQLAHPKSQNKLPKDIEKGMSKKRHSNSVRRNRSRRAGREATSRRVTPEAAVSKDQDPPERRIMPFLPDPPSFDLSVNVKQWHDLSRGQGALSKVIRQDGASGLNLSVQHVI
jgi:hypothetical protein